MTFKAKKDPDAILDYRIDWSELLSNNTPVDTITSSSWAVIGSLIIDSDSNTTTDTTVWVSGGTLKDLSLLTNSIVTANNPSRTFVRTIEVSILDT